MPTVEPIGASRADGSTTSCPSSNSNRCTISGIGLSSSTTPTKNAVQLQRITVPLTVLYCPTRRQAIAYPWKTDGWGNVNTDMPTVVGREDYAANGGDPFTAPDSGGGPSWGSSFENTGGGPLQTTQVDNPSGQMTDGARKTFAAVAQLATGIAYCGSMTRVADVTDGVSNTYLLGEKYLNPDSYVNGQDGADNESAFMGDNADIVRVVCTRSQQSSHLLAADAGYAGQRRQLGFRQHPRQRLQHGLLRRLVAVCQLHDQPGSPPPPVQPQGWDAGRSQVALSCGSSRVLP